MKCVKVELSKDIKQLKVYILADDHIGDEYCDLERTKNIIETVRKDPNAVLIVNGDILNNATRTSVSDCYTEKYSIKEQIALGVKLLTPVKGKIVFMTTGNHEYRTYKKEGVDLMDLIAAQLGLSDKFCPYGGVLVLRFGTLRTDKARKGGVKKNTYSIYVTHGVGGGRTAGSKINKLSNLSLIVDTDIYVRSHTHFPCTFKQAFYRADSRNASVQFVEKLFVNTGAGLDYGGYGQQFEYPPASKASPVIFLDGGLKNAEAKV